MVTHELSGTLRFPDDATDVMKRWVARDMVRRGDNFAAAAVLLKREAGDGYVWRHNLCQAVELVLKGLLLFHDFNANWPKMRRYGHRLVVLADATANAFGVKRPDAELRRELSALTELYEAHQLRYASCIGAFIDPDAIPYEAVLGRLVAARRLLYRAERRGDVRT